MTNQNDRSKKLARLVLTRLVLKRLDLGKMRQHHNSAAAVGQLRSTEEPSPSSSTAVTTVFTSPGEDLAQIRERVPLHLEAVSRSFAFCIARLEPVLREPIGLAYLLCRMLDTIEDSPWESSEAQSAAYDHFLKCLVEPKLEFAKGTTNWPWAQFREAEQSLFRDFEALRELWWVQPPQVRQAVEDCVRSMQKGMHAFRLAVDSSQDQPSGEVLSLGSLGDVNRYCFFVAGVVGEMLTRVFRGVEPAFAPKPQDSWRFGLFLQKVNILKDQATDEREGRRLVPSRRALLHSAILDAEAAWRYLQAIPPTWPGYQLFCGWSFFLGLETLLRMSPATPSESQPAPSRWQTLELIAQIENDLADPQAWSLRAQSLMKQLREALGEISALKTMDARVPWPNLARAYQGEFTLEDLQSLTEA